VAKSPNPPGTKLVKRFIKHAQGENTAYRLILRQLAPKDRLCADPK
jgi:hypothetical protein